MRWLPVLITVFFIATKAEWIKFSESGKILQEDVTPKSKYLSEVFGTASAVTTIDVNANRPGQEWEEYQKERSRMSGHAKILIVTDRLKNSAEIIVPPMKIAPKLDLHNITATGQLDVEVFGNGNSTSKSVARKNIVSVVDMNFVSDGPTRNQSESGAPSQKWKRPSVEEASSSAKLPSIQGFVEFLKTLQNNLIGKTSFGIMDKIAILKDLRDQLLINIEDRIRALWREEKNSRQKRGLFEETSNNFPTAEIAIMTINFLTFAVFLIKLVLQVINIIKSKHYSFNGFSALTSTDNIKTAKSRLNARKFGGSQRDLKLTENVLNSISSLKV